MGNIEGWWFAPADKKLANGDNRKIRLGITHKVKGEIVPCKNGLHLSKKLLDALRYAPGPIIYRVRGSGVIVPHGCPTDKYACSERTYISGGIDCTDALKKFARLCALEVIDLWDAPQIVVTFLKGGDESLKVAASAASAAFEAASAAWEARGAFEAAWEAREAANAAWEAREAVWEARGAAWEARGAAWKGQNRRLTAMISNLIKK